MVIPLLLSIAAGTWAKKGKKKKNSIRGTVIFFSFSFSVRITNSDINVSSHLHSATRISRHSRRVCFSSIFVSFVDAREKQFAIEINNSFADRRSRSTLWGLWNLSVFSRAHLQISVDRWLTFCNFYHAPILLNAGVLWEIAVCRSTAGEFYRDSIENFLPQSLHRETWRNMEQKFSYVS